MIIVQENRSVDNLFQFLRGANTQSYGLNSQGQEVSLRPIQLTAPYNIGHVHISWLAEYNNGAMNGFDQETCRGKCPTSNAAYGYVPRNEVEPYYTMAKAYTFADEMFQTNQGPSFPAHQYLISGTSTVNNTHHRSCGEQSADGRCEVDGRLRFARRVARRGYQHAWGRARSAQSLPVL